MPFMNRKSITIVLSLILLLLLTSCSQENTSSDRLRISTGILPIKAFTKTIGGEYVDVEALIPVGANPHNYQPSPSSMKFLSDADLYIYVGVPTENDNIMPKLYDFNQEIQVLNLQAGLAAEHPFLVDEDHGHESESSTSIETASTETVNDSDHDGELVDFEAQMVSPSTEIGAYADYDPHTWVSPKRAITIVTQIKDTLVQMDPQHKETFTANADTLIKQLAELDQKVEDKVASSDQKIYLIYHSSYNYFAYDYGLSFISIENEGKSPTIQDIQNAIDIAKENNIKTLFYQNEFSVEQARSISEQIGGNAVPLEPLSENYFDAMNLLIQHIDE